MSILRLLLAEMGHRKLNCLMSVIAISAAAGLFVAGPVILSSYQADSAARVDEIRQTSQARIADVQRQTDADLTAMRSKASDDLKNLDKRTKRIMRDLGFNLRIVHRDTDLAGLHANFVAHEMPESYIQQLADSPAITKIVHLVATLKQMIQWHDKPHLLVGMAPEATQSHIEKKAPMGFAVQQGTVYLGHEAAKGHKLGDKIQVLGTEFTVARILDQHGTREEDIAIVMHLHDAQSVLKKPGKISEIVALGCKCKTAKRIEEIREQLAIVLPEAKVMEVRTSAVARDQQRKAVEKYHQQAIADYENGQVKIVQQIEQRQIEMESQTREQQRTMLQLLSSFSNYAMPALVLICIVWSGILAWLNVRERRSEIGLLRAVGRGSPNIAALFLGKAIALGLTGGLLGGLFGLAISRYLALQVLEIGPQHVPWQQTWLYLTAAILGAPLVAAMASYLPTVSALTQDPARVLLD